ncbi:MAG: replication initiation factor domain-containing protein [Proteobacteria bacterium]|nr:replication initiation factor domain-containing protein [Pseudomonadota bacterium]
MDIVHSGYDSLKLTVDVDIPEEFLGVLMEAKQIATGQNSPEVTSYNGIDIQVRKTGGVSAFSVSTGEYGAEWYFLDPHNKPKNNPGIQVDFRAFLLASGGIEAAKAQFQECMSAFGIRYADHLVKVSRVDFAVDILAPGFEPVRKRIIAPPNTRSQERDAEPGTEHGIGEKVSGVTAGHISNRQLSIYNKRREIIDNKKLGWVEIWNDRRMHESKPAIDLKDKHNSQVWRFELRMGSKQLRNRWEIRSWDDLEARIGDALEEFMQKVRYTYPDGDSNRSRWPTHPVWKMVAKEIAGFFDGKRNFTEPSIIKTVNRESHKAMLDSQILGTIVSRAAAEKEESDFDNFVEGYCKILKRLSREHPVSFETRYSNAKDRYIFK